MDKQLIFAVAGAGKTTFLIKQLDIKKRILILTYTEANYQNLRNRILEKFGKIPTNITLFTYFSFLYSFCFRPFFALKIKPSRLTFEDPPFVAVGNKKFFSKSREVYASQLANFLMNNGLADLKNRIEKHFDCLFIDEVEDFSGHDFDFILGVSKFNIAVKFVGDFYQYTYDTSRAGNKNKNIHNNYSTYKSKFRNFSIDESSLNKSYRCPLEVCNFITTMLGVKMDSYKPPSSLKIDLIEDKSEIERIMNDDSVKKLFYKEHDKYSCKNHDNWANCKGLGFENVCVILNKTTFIEYKKNSFLALKTLTRNKLYVACSRVEKSLCFIEEKQIKHLKVKK